MRYNYYFATFIGTAAVFLVSQSGMGQQAPNIYQQVRQSIVIIQNITGVRQGTGFIINGENGTYYVLTAGHVVRDGQQQFQVRTDSGEIRPVEIIIPLPGVDLALLQFASTRQYQPVKLASETNMIQAPAQIYILGYPANESGDPQMPIGNVTSRSNSSIFHNVFTAPGMSGSPVLNGNGEVVGIHVGLATRSSFSEAVPIEKYKELIPLIFIQTSRSNLAAGRFDQAIAGIEEGRRLLPQQDNPDASIILAYAYFGKGELSRAREEATKVKRINSNNEEAALLLGAIDYLQGNFNSAINNLSNFSSTRPPGSYALAILGLSHAGNSNIQQAELNTSRAVQSLQNDSFVSLARSCIQFKSGNLEGARTSISLANLLSEQKPSNLFFAVLSPKLQEVARVCLPPNFSAILTQPPLVAGRYKSSSPLDLGVGATALAVSNDNQFIAVGLRDSYVSIYNLQTKNRIGFFGSGQGSTLISSVAFSPDGRDIAVASASGQIRVFNIQTREQRYTLGNVGGFPTIVFSNNNRYLFVGSNSGTLRLVDNRGGEIIAAESITHGSGINSLVLSPDGRLLASGGGDGMVKLWSTSDLIPIGNYQANRAEVQSLAFSADGSRIISADFDVVKSCNWQTKQCTEIARSISNQVIRGLAVGSNGHLAYSAGNRIFLQDRRNGQSLGDLSGHGDSVNALAYTPDGRYLISGSDDKTIIIWEVQ